MLSGHLGILKAACTPFGNNMQINLWGDSEDCPVSNRIQKGALKQVKAVAQISLPLSNIMVVENLWQIWMLGLDFGKTKLGSFNRDP